MRKTHSFLGILAGVLLLAASGISPAQSPAPSATQLSGQSLADLKALNLLIGEIQAQQKAIAENQVAIDQKIASLAETIRMARIFSKRGGGTTK